MELVGNRKPIFSRYRQTRLRDLPFKNDEIINIKIIEKTEKFLIIEVNGLQRFKLLNSGRLKDRNIGETVNCLYFFQEVEGTKGYGRLIDPNF